MSLNIYEFTPDYVDIPADVLNEHPENIVPNGSATALPMVPERAVLRG